MTTDINDDLNVPVHSITATSSVAVIAEHNLSDIAYQAFVEGLGYRAMIVDVDGDYRLSPPAAGTVIVRSAERLSRISATGAFAGARMIGIGVPIGRLRGIRLPDSAAAAGALRQALGAVAGPGPQASGRVHLSDRECEVVATYVLGATVRETASRHYIAESTVRTHLRRVMDRYVCAGRPVNNKSQLLIELITDGWVDQARLLAQRVMKAS
ncbi:LuxR C-terminal-related transcriptional regulator [Gordonia sp. NPDC003376]